MRHERQVELLRRVQESGDRFQGLHTDASRTNSTASYADPERFALEQRRLFRKGPIFFGSAPISPSRVPIGRCAWTAFRWSWCASTTARWRRS
ncbi:MAG: hypothetical protein R2710_05990 [Acidimicrobiales bacterium]